MIETEIIEYLGATLELPVYAEVPASNQNPPADYFIVVEKTGSSRINLINTATIAVQSYAPSLFEAASLNESVKHAMFDIIKESDTITRCQINSDYAYTRVETKQPRYQAVFDITHY